MSVSPTTELPANSVELHLKTSQVLALPLQGCSRAGELQAPHSHTELIHPSANVTLSSSFPSLVDPRIAGILPPILHLAGLYAHMPLISSYRITFRRREMFIPTAFSDTFIQKCFPVVETILFAHKILPFL